MRLVHLPSVKHKVAETLSHTALSVLHRHSWRADVAFLFNAANAPFLSVLRAARVPTAVHVDGLEWKRSKWGPAGRRYYLANERLAVRWGTTLIADARGIQDYYRERYSADSVYIPYGASIQDRPRLQRLAELELREQAYHLVVARFEPENHIHLALEAYSISQLQHALVVVGGAPYAERYVADLEQQARRCLGIRMTGGIWDQELLDALYAGSLTYIHGHSVGGTNPSLLRAMGAGASVLAYDVNFNREVLQGQGRFWSCSGDLAALLRQAESDPAAEAAMGKGAQLRAAGAYTWDSVADAYEKVAETLSTNGRPSYRPRGSVL